jgi:hypothetical protein
MVDDPANPESALGPLITSLARLAARASADLGVELDVSDPRVARWMILTSFEALCMPTARRALEETLAIAADLPQAEPVRARPRKGQRRGDPPLVTWDDIVASTGEQRLSGV